MTTANSSLIGKNDISISGTASKSVLQDMQQVMHLLKFGQTLCGQMHDAIDRLCQEVKLITQGHAQLFLGHQETSGKVLFSPTTSITLPVQFGNFVYGTLSIAFDPIHNEQLTIPLPVAQLLAQTCSLLIYTFEQSEFVQGQCQQLDYQVHGSLTKREREVLLLMYRGNGQETIALKLCIAPSTVGKHRQHIYDQLGVHCERDALLAAYHTGIFSLVGEHSSECVEVDMVLRQK